MRTTPTVVIRAGLLAFALLLSGATPAFSQERHSVRIQDGSVFIDGDRVPAQDLPPSLHIEDVQLRLEFSGQARFHVDGIQYGLKDGRIVELPPDADDFVVYFTDDSDGAAGTYDVARAGTATVHYRLADPANQTIGTYLQVLDEQAAQFEKISAELSRQRSDNPVVVANQLREEAEQAAIMVRAFPRVEVQTYLRGIQDRDKPLYDRLLREQRMEVASGELARRVFAAGDDEMRRSLTESLRAQLEEIFELKQQNRRDEIEQLEMQLGELRQQLAARERNRDAIIDKRLNALIGLRDR